MSTPNGLESMLHFGVQVVEADRDRIVSFVEKLGYTAAFAPSGNDIPSEPPARAPGAALSFDFSGLTHPDDVLVREHLEDLSAVVQQKPRNFIRALHVVMDSGNLSRLFQYNKSVYTRGSTRRFEQTREPRPVEGVRVVRREAAGIAPYSPRLSQITDKDARIMLGYGLTVGSLLPRNNPGLLRNVAQIGGVGHSTLSALNIVIGKLDDQVAK